MADFSFDAEEVWWDCGQLTCFRSLSAAATYSPADPFPGWGRFGNGKRLVLYVASSSDGALAEFFRHRPELLQLQDHSVVQVFEVVATPDGNLVDVRTESQATALGFPSDRLISKDVDESIRYSECRELADAVEQIDIGIAYPSAALDGAWNIALFGQRGSRWNASVGRKLQPPEIELESIDPVPEPS